jgi:hypothetical protein
VSHIGLGSRCRESADQAATGRSLQMIRESLSAGIKILIVDRHCTIDFASSMILSAVECHILGDLMISSDITHALPWHS